MLGWKKLIVSEVFLLVLSALVTCFSCLLNEEAWFLRGASALTWIMLFFLLIGYLIDWLVGSIESSTFLIIMCYLVCAIYSAFFAALYLETLFGYGDIGDNTTVFLFPALLCAIVPFVIIVDGFDTGGSPSLNFWGRNEELLAGASIIITILIDFGIFYIIPKLI